MVSTILWWWEGNETKFFLCHLTGAEQILPVHFLCCLGCPLMALWRDRAGASGEHTLALQGWQSLLDAGFDTQGRTFPGNARLCCPSGPRVLSLCALPCFQNLLFLWLLVLLSGKNGEKYVTHTVLSGGNASKIGAKKNEVFYRNKLDI